MNQFSWLKFTFFSFSLFISFNFRWRHIKSKVHYQVSSLFNRQKGLKRPSPLYRIKSTPLVLCSIIKNWETIDCWKNEVKSNNVVTFQNNLFIEIIDFFSHQIKLKSREMTRMIIRAWAEIKKKSFFIFLFLFFGKSCPYFIDISFHVTQSSSWYSTERETEKLWCFFISVFPLEKKRKIQSRHRVFPKQLPSGLDVRVYSSLCGCDAALCERMTRGVALWEIKKGSSLSTFILILFLLLPNKMRHIQKVYLMAVP